MHHPLDLPQQGKPCLHPQSMIQTKEAGNLQAVLGIHPTVKETN